MEQFPTPKKTPINQLTQIKQQYDTLFNSMKEMIVLHEVVTDKDGQATNYRITDCNQAFTEITGIPKNKAIGQLASELYQSDPAPYLSEFTEVGLTGIDKQLITYYPPMDKHFIISVVSPKIGEFATITTDITDMKNQQEIIETKNKELENYLYIASHDLRSPLVNIQGFSQLLKGYIDTVLTTFNVDQLEKEQKQELEPIIDQEIPKALEYISTSIIKMDRLIKGLLKISRTGRVEMKVEKINMNQLLQNILKALEFQIREQQIEIQINDLKDCYGDLNLLNQLFTNLITNAIKYRSRKRKLIIKIDSQIEYQHVKYIIQDNGIGIAEKHLDRIWEVFYQVDSKKPDSGDGIGLNIVKRIVDKHKGKVSIESEEGKGSTFYIKLQKNHFESTGHKN